MTEVLEKIPQTRQQKRKLGRDTKKGRINQQYDYTTEEAISTEFQKRGSFDWLPSKAGQTIEQWWLDRIKQQKNSSSYTKPIPMGCFGVHNNTDIKLDDKIREFICDLEYHLDVDYEGGKEWILTKVDDIYEKLNFYPTSIYDILNNEEFMKLWFERIEDSKKKYFENINQVSKVYNLKEWQGDAVKEMLVSGKKYHVLGLAPRFGKTLTILDYLKEKVLSGEYSKEELWLVPASKSLSSNASVINDYNEFGFIQYFNVVTNTSLFVDEDKIIERLKNTLPPNAKIVLLTDEADSASHTKISVEKIQLIKDNFNIVEQIVMTGTGIGKATKIFKGVSYDDVHFHYRTYSEMVEMGGRVTKRNIINLQYNIEKDFGDEKVLNIRQTASNPLNHPQLAEYIGDLTINPLVEKMMNLRPTEIVMVFLRPDTNKFLESLVEVYENMYSDKVKCMVLTRRNQQSNRTAEKNVKKTYNDMRKVGDNRKLIVFSTGDIGSRSFSVSKIYREINFCDTELTSATLQEFARPLTWEDGKDVADIIRVGFTDMNLAEELYLMENEVPDGSPKSYSSARRYLMCNSFSNWRLTDGEWKDEKLVPNGVDDEVIGQFLDKVSKFTDNTNYIMTRISTEGLIVDTEPSKKGSKQKTKVVNTSVKKGKKLQTTKTKNGDDKLKADDFRRLEQYINISRCIPSMAHIHGIETIQDFFKSGYWSKYLEIDKKIFEQNYNDKERFRGVIDSLFRGNSSYTPEEHDQRIVEYFKFRS
tara:strand:+ start:142 stop:2415 length:2274 start_codon:yes stop_codon:yes gene_type:complete